MTTEGKTARRAPARGQVRISNVTLDRCGAEANIGFDIEWDGSWRNDDNWDAAWVFIKLQTQERIQVDNTPEVKASLERGDLAALRSIAIAALAAKHTAASHAVAPRAVATEHAAGPPGPPAPAPRPPGPPLPRPAEVMTFLANHGLPVPVPPAPASAPAPAQASPPLPMPPFLPGAPPFSDWLAGMLDVKPSQAGGWVIRQENRIGGGAPSNDETLVEHIRARVVGPRVKSEVDGPPGPLHVHAPSPAAATKIELSKPSAWQHATIMNVESAPKTATVTISKDGLGVFVHRSKKAKGAGPVCFERVVLHVKPAAIAADFEGNVSIWVFGIEMVMIPKGEFSSGDPAGPSGPNACFYDAGKASTEHDRTYRVTSEDPIDVGATGDGTRLAYNSGTAIGNLGDGKGPVPKRFPKGVRPFYVMKYQITQAQYGDFVNTLTGHARTVRFSYWYGDYRYTIFMTQSGQRVTLRPDRACNWLSWMDGAAFACWAGLRPMTELEFEKACRGPSKAVAGEFAWGTTNLKQAQVIFGDEDAGATVNGNCAYGNFRFIGGDSGSGPLPGHVFGAANANSASEIAAEGRATFEVADDYETDEIAPDMRERRGASFYGVLGLSGNLWEWCITLGNALGRRFSGKHGTGALDGFGNPDTKRLRWPSVDTSGACVRGGSWYTASDQVRLADRSYGSGLEGYATRSHDFGFRCARTAPTRVKQKKDAPVDPATPT